MCLTCDTTREIDVFTSGVLHFRCEIPNNLKNGPICELFKYEMVFHIFSDSLHEQAKKTSTAAHTTTQNTRDRTIFACCGGTFQEYKAH